MNGMRVKVNNGLIEAQMGAVIILKLVEILVQPMKILIWAQDQI